MKFLLNKTLLFILISIFSIISFFSSRPLLATEKSCQNGHCTEKLIDRLEDFTILYQDKCDQSKKASQIKNELADTLTEECWKLLTEINHLEKKLQDQKTILEQKLECNNGSCKEDKGQSPLISQTFTQSHEENLSCSEKQKQTIKKECPNDVSCAFVASATSIGGYVAEILVPEKMKPKNCNLADDNCTHQIITGFIKAVMSFFGGTWDLIKLAGNKFWSWVSGPEAHSSTSQLALAKASEDPGVFKMLTDDFSGTMSKITQALVSSLKEWLKNDIFCQKWSGVPHLGECLQPTKSFDCMSCKTMINGACAISGTILSEVVPAFLTGGLVTAAKYGAGGAAKISKLFKVSNSSIKTIKNSKLAKFANSTATKIDNAISSSKIINTGKKGLEQILKNLTQYLSSPARKFYLESYSKFKKLSKTGPVELVLTQSGKVLSFGAKGAKGIFNVVIYPFENPLTIMAYKSGERSFDKLIKLTRPQLASPTLLTSAIMKSTENAELLLTKIEEARHLNKTDEVLKYQEELHQLLISLRKETLTKVLSQQEIDFEEIILRIYPELNYGSLGQKLGENTILNAEKELFYILSSLSEGKYKEDILKRYFSHVSQNPFREKVVSKGNITHQKILENSKLSDKDRWVESLKLIGRKQITEDEKNKLYDALQKAHLYAPENGVFEYSWRELRAKHKILLDGGFTEDEANLLIRSGLAGRPPVRELIKPGDTLFHGFASDILDQKYLDKRDKLDHLLKQKYSNHQEIIDNLESLYFIDYSHSSNKLKNILSNNNTIDNAELSIRYETRAFENFKKTREYLLNERPEMNKQTLLEIHKRMMEGGVEGVRSEWLGAIRDGNWYGNVPYQYPLDEITIKEILENPYLTWRGQKNVDGKFWGEIHYPNLDYIRKEGLDLIRNRNPKLVKDIEDYQNLPKKMLEKETELKLLSVDDKAGAKGFALKNEIYTLKQRHTKLASMSLKLNQQLVEAMVDDLMDWFNRQRALIGEIDSPEKLDQFTDLVAKFQRDLVSIHPLANGNGRSTREFALSYALMREGFPPPRILDPNADMYTSLDDWKKMIKHGILSSDYLVDDLIERLNFGLPVENSLDLITPFSRPPVALGLKGQKGVNTIEGVEYIDPRFYREVLKREFNQNPSFVKELESEPVKTWDKIHNRIREIFSKNNIYYNHPKHGIERVALNFVDDDFKLLFGKNSYQNKELFDFKMKNWYSEDITWRGLASNQVEKSEADIIKMFQEFTEHNASNAVLRKISRINVSDEIRKAALEDFEKFNQDVFGDGLVQMAKDHSETGPLYRTSYGYSTSKNREVGKAFAMGAMVVADYGAHRAPELQALLKSRVLVGARRANKDVDLGRLKQVREDFSYKYGRQQEVMGIGATEPDAISIVQTIDAKGEVVLSYLRNPDNPSEVFVIKGDIDPNTRPRADQIEKVVRLK